MFEKMKRKTVLYAGFTVFVVLTVFVGWEMWKDPTDPLVDSPQVITTTLGLGIPSIIHQTWKQSVTPPSELVRWRNGCMKLNKEFNFKIYSDEQLHAFTKEYYPQYLAMFEHLYGVCESSFPNRCTYLFHGVPFFFATDMADMARVLITYHYGGIYADLDFYCRRPYHCLIDQAQQQLMALDSSPVGDSNSNRNSNHNSNRRSVLVVPREPLAHAIMFRNKTRVVIQVILY